MNRSPDEFQAAATERKLGGLHLRDCSLCGYPIAYYFGAEGVSLDTGCDCVSYGPVIRPSSWQAVADHYNAQTNAGYLAKLDEHFGFSSVLSSDRSEPR